MCVDEEVSVLSGMMSFSGYRWSMRRCGVDIAVANCRFEVKQIAGLCDSQIRRSMAESGKLLN